MFNFLNGYKLYILGGFAILVAALKFATDIPEIEAINVLGATDPWTLVTTGFGIIGGKSAVEKLEK